MRSKKYIITFALFFLSLFLTGAAGAGEGNDERTMLMEQQKQLHARAEALKLEQDFLLFQKTMYAADSKYLVLNVVEKTGQLKYKNRVLKDLRFTPSKDFHGALFKPGKLVLTKKAEGKRDRHALIFGNALVIQWKRDKVPQQEKKIPVLSLKRKEMLSLFFALEEGALAYIVR